MRLPGWHRDIGIVAAATLLVTACNVSVQAEQLGEACLNAIAKDALRNPVTNEFAANFAGPLGLTSSSDLSAPPWRMKQVEFPGADGDMHYFAIDSMRWTKAALIRVTPAAEAPQLTIFVIDRQGRLLNAGEMQGNRLSLLDVNEGDVRARFQQEVRAWLGAARSPPSPPAARAACA